MNPQLDALLQAKGNRRDGAFGQHLRFKGQASQSNLLARYKSVLPSCTLRVVLRVLPPGQVYLSCSASKLKSLRENVPSLRVLLSQTGICGSMPRSVRLLSVLPEP